LINPEEILHKNLWGKVWLEVENLKFERSNNVFAQVEVPFRSTEELL
jgi:hypothetical protein